MPKSKPPYPAEFPKQIIELARAGRTPTELSKHRQLDRAGCARPLRQLTDYARGRHRDDLAALLEHPGAERAQRARAVMDAIETLRHLPAPRPIVTDDVARWLPTRAAGAMKAHGIKTLADLTVRIPRRRRWWTAIAGLGAVGARQIGAFFAAAPPPHPASPRASAYRRPG